MNTASAERRRPVERLPRLAAVVLNYRSPDDTFLAVRSLMASRRAIDDIIVIDNDAETSRLLRRLADESHGEAIYLPMGRNLGFSGGVNVGVRAALERGADAVLLVNSDVVVPPDCADRLERALQDSPKSGISGPLVVDRSAPERAFSMGISYNPGTGRMRNDGAGSNVPTNRPTPRSVDALSGCLMLVRREVFDAIGWFDEDYFFSFEDIDFCLRARAAGFEVVLVGEATVYHEGSRSIGATSPTRYYFAARNHLLLAHRAAAARSRLARAALTSNIVMLNLAYTVTAKGGTFFSRVSAVVAGTRDYLAGRYGTGRGVTAFGGESTMRDRNS